MMGRWWEALGMMGEPIRRLADLFGSDKTETVGPQRPAKANSKTEAQDGVKANAGAFYTPGTKSKWDAFIDGFNRLPRPLLTTAIVGFFVIAPFYPDEFLKIASAYEKLPNGFWALLSVVVGFYFTGRMQSKQHALQIHEALEQVVEREGNPNNTNEVVAYDPAELKIEQDYQRAISKRKEKKPNQVISQWKAKRDSN